MKGIAQRRDAFCYPTSFSQPAQKKAKKLMQNAEGIDCKKSGEKVLTKGGECVILTEPLR